MSIGKFPVELLKLIAVELSDKDLYNFCLVCRIFCRAVQGDQMVWRARFLKLYDEPAKSRRNAYDWKTTYQQRQRLLQRDLGNIKFQSGTSDKEREALEILQDLLLDAYGHTSSDAELVTSRNFAYIRSAKPNTPLSSFYRSLNPLLSTVNVLLTPLLNLPERHLIGLTQYIVYTPATQWILNPDDTPSMHVLEAIAQFFTYHIHPESESDVFHQRTLLKPYELPGFWEGRLGDDEAGVAKNIPTKWFGAYTFTNALNMHRDQDPVPDISDSHLVDMKLSFHSPPGVGPTEQHFTGTGRDFSDFTVISGKMTPLPSPPEMSSITGWKKVLFIKDYRSHRWVYEGIMLPGNNMILGHWRSRMNDYSFRSRHGPFILWSAPESSSLAFRDNRVSVRQ